MWLFVLFCVRLVCEDVSFLILLGAKRPPYSPPGGGLLLYTHVPSHFFLSWMRCCDDDTDDFGSQQ